MTTKKTTTKKTTKKTDTRPLKTTFTLREVEAAEPCSYEYISFLQDLKSNPIDLLVRKGVDFEPYKRPRYGPDDPIELIEVYRKGSSGELSSLLRVDWLLRHLKGLKRFAAARDRRVKNIENVARVEISHLREAILNLEAKSADAHDDSTAALLVAAEAAAQLRRDAKARRKRTT